MLDGMLEKHFFAAYSAGGAFAASLNKVITSGIARIVGGAVSAADGNGWAIKVGRIMVRVMTSSNARNNYFKISIVGKQAYDIFGNVTNDPGRLHIPITMENIVRLVQLILKLKG